MIFDEDHDAEAAKAQNGRHFLKSIALDIPALVLQIMEQTVVNLGGFLIEADELNALDVVAAG